MKRKELEEAKVDEPEGEKVDELEGEKVDELEEARTGGLEEEKIEEAPVSPFGTSYQARLSVQRERRVNDKGETVLWKTCTVCVKMQCQDQYPRRSAKHGDGFGSKCNTCLKEQNEAARKAIQEKTCTQCHTLKPAASFGHRRHGSKDGLKSSCKKCEADADDAKRQTVYGYFQHLLSHAVAHARQRLALGRASAGVCTLTVSDIEAMALRQNNRCYYSNLQLSYRSGTSFQATLERLNEDLGYTVDNTRLVIMELNNRAQWSEEKIKEHIQLRLTPVDEKQVETLLGELRTIPPKQKRHTRKNRLNAVTSQLEWFCYLCDVWKVEVDMAANHPTYCKECDAKSRTNTSRAVLVKLLHGCALSTKKRQRTLKRQRMEDNELSYDDVLAILRRQQNRCFYSGVPLDWTATADHWAPSLERLNVALPYTKENVVLVCRAFNALDFSAMATRHKKTVEDEDRNGWSQAKYNVFLKSVTDEYERVITACATA